MLKMFLIVPLFLISFISCQTYLDKSYNYERDTPDWLKIKIDSISTSAKKYYFGTTVNRYRWNDKYLFEFTMPFSSCLLCELYYYDGTKTNFPNDSTAQDYTRNRADKILVWKYPD